MAMQAELTMNPVTAGCFCWNELATWDTDAASSFYCDLFGWTAENTDCGDKSYTLFKKDGNPVSGMMKMDSNWPEDTPSYWGSYIAVDDVDATASRVESCGGKLCCGPEDAGEGGRYAVITDPTGATFSIYKGGDGMNATGCGSFCWNELLTTDMDSASSFYTGLFGWSAEASPATDEPYTVFKIGEAWAGGMMKMHWEGTPSWLGYISVADVDATTAKATEMGCSVCVEPMDIPSMGRFAVFTDPVGATIAVFTHQSECSNDSSCCS